MNKILVSILATAVLFGSYGYNGSTTSAVTLVGGIVKAQHTESVKKYRRKDCPVCKGTGYYISGDKITKVTCGYCIPDKTESPKFNQPKVIVHPPVIIQQNCPNGVCPIPKK
jgi:hypothetical protein